MALLRQRSQRDGGRPIWQTLAEREARLRSGSLGRRAGFALGVVLAILTISTAGYVLIENAGWFESFYMTVITVATVGYAEIFPLGTGGRVFTVFVIAMGVSTILYVASLVAQYLLSGELAGLIGQRRMNKQIADLKGHYLVCGYGRTGRRVAGELKRRGLDVIVIDIEEPAVAEAIVQGFPSVHGDAGSDATLRQAGVEHASGMAIALPTDPDALMAVITARSLNREMTIVTRAADESSESKLEFAGASSVLPMHQMAGHNLAQMVTQPEFAVFLEAILSDHGIELGATAVRLGQSSPVVSLTLGESGLTGYAETSVFGIRSVNGTPAVISGQDEVLKAGDIIVIVGTRQRLTELKEKVSAAKV